MILTLNEREIWNQIIRKERERKRKRKRERRTKKDGQKKFVLPTIHPSSTQQNKIEY